MALDALKAAKYMCKKSDWSLDNLRLQKILYIAQVGYLGTREEPLIQGEFEAWRYGPVHPDVHQKLKIFGSKTITWFGFLGVGDLEDGEPKSKYLDSAVEALKDCKSSKLIAITHMKDGAWERVYDPSYTGRQIITTVSMKQEYQQRKEKQQNRKLEK